MKKLSILVLITLTTLSYGRLYHSTEAVDNTRTSIEHLVFVKFKEGTPQSSIAEFSKKFGDLKSSISIVKGYEAGLNKSAEQKNKGFTHLYKFSFDSVNDRDLYLIHEAHKEFGSYAGSLGIIEDVLVFDY